MSDLRRNIRAVIFLSKPRKQRNGYTIEVITLVVISTQNFKIKTSTEMQKVGSAVKYFT